MTNLVDAVGTTKYSYTVGGQLWTEDGPWSNDTVTNLYNNRLRTGLGLAQPTGVWTNRFGYDPARRLTNVTSSAGVFSYYFKAGQASRLPIKLALPNTSYITNSYDGNARLIVTRLKNSANSSLDAQEYLYNTGNQRTIKQDQGANYIYYTYDPSGQLRVADNTVITADDRGYAYDKAWNLSYRTNNGTGSALTVDGKNQLVTQAEFGYYDYYDDNGNLQWQVYGGPWWYYGAQDIYQFGYDDENRLVSLTYYDYSSTPVWATTFAYDGMSRLRKRVEYSNYDSESSQWGTTQETRYVYDGNRVIQERDGSNVPKVSYTRGSDLSGSLEGAGGIGGMLARSHGYSSGNWSTHNYYHADGNGNITYLVNNSQTLAASYRYAFNYPQVFGENEDSLRIKCTNLATCDG